MGKSWSGLGCCYYVSVAALLYGISLLSQIKALLDERAKFYAEAMKNQDKQVFLGDQWNGFYIEPY